VLQRFSTRRTFEPGESIDDSILLHVGVNDRPVPNRQRARTDLNDIEVYYSELKERIKTARRTGGRPTRTPAPRTPAKPARKRPTRREPTFTEG
jgi:hypothetical protein